MDVRSLNVSTRLAVVNINFFIVGHDIYCMFQSEQYDQGSDNESKMKKVLIRYELH